MKSFDFNKILKQYKNMIYKVINKYPFIYHEDLYQECVIALYKACLNYDEKFAAFSTHAFNSIRGAAYHYHRDRCSTVRIPRTEYESGVHSVQYCEYEDYMLDRYSCDKTDDKIDTCIALNSVTMSERQLLIHHYIKGMSKKEMARNLNVSDTTVANKLHRVLNKLKELYQ